MTNCDNEIKILSLSIIVRYLLYNNHRIMFWLKDLKFKWFQSGNCFQTNWSLVQFFKAECKYASVISINDEAANRGFLDLYLKNVQENPGYKEPCRKMKSKIKLNSEHLYSHAPLEINANWRMKYFFWYRLKQKNPNFNINTVNAIQTKFVYLHEMGKQMKSSILLTVL